MRFSFTNRLAPAVWAAILVSTANAAVQSIDFAVFGLRFRALNSNIHVSIFGLASLAACLVAALTAFRLGGRTGRGALFLPLALLAIFVLRVWYPPDVLLFALPFAIGAVVMLWRIGAANDRKLIQAGCVLLVVSFAIHASWFSVSGFGAPPHHNDWGFQLFSLLKHNSELAGWFLVSAGLFSLTSRTWSRSSIRNGRSATPVRSSSLGAPPERKFH